VSLTPVEWFIAPRVKCDLVGYSGVNLTGARYVVRIFPTGTRKGTFRTEELKSLVIVAPVGVRVVLCTSATAGWEELPWRCIRMTAENRFRNDKDQEGVRVPDLDWMDPADARKVSPDLQQSYPYVQTLAEGTTWTFGRRGATALKDQIRAFRLDLG
jgi:hypothetical protein